MALPVYDFRTDIRNIFVTPQIRSRFLRFEVGTVAQRHSHDLGHEIFLVLSGRAEFDRSSRQSMRSTRAGRRLQSRPSRG